MLMTLSPVTATESHVHDDTDSTTSPGILVLLFLALHPGPNSLKLHFRFFSVCVFFPHLPSMQRHVVGPAGCPFCPLEIPVKV